MNYPKCILEALASLEKKRTVVLSMVEDVRFAETLIEKFRNIKGTDNWYVSIGYEFGTLNGISVHVTADDFRELTQVRRWLRQRGFPSPAEEEYPEIGRRSWRYNRGDGRNLFYLCAHVKSNSNATCQYVKVGTKEEPIYELRCGNEPYKDDKDVVPKIKE